MAELVQRRRVVGACGRELGLLRQSNRVGEEIVVGPVATVLDASSRVSENHFGTLVGIPRARLLLERRQAIDLLGVEHRGVEDTRALEQDGHLLRVAVRIQHRLAGAIALDLLFRELPVLDARSSLALPHLGSELLSLPIRHPARITAVLQHQAGAC